MEWKTPSCQIGALAAKTLALFVRLESARYLLPVKEIVSFRNVCTYAQMGALVFSWACRSLCENTLLPFAYLKGTPARTFSATSDKGRADLLGCSLLKWDSNVVFLFLYRLKERERERESDRPEVITACLFKNINVTTQTLVYLSSTRPLITFSRISSRDPKHWVILS